MSELPGWVQIGAQVAVESWVGGWNPRVTVHTVERLTATQIVLDSGIRVRRGDLGLIGANRGELLPLSDPKVTRARATRHVQNVRRDVDQLLKDVGQVGPDRALDLLDELAGIVANARASVAALKEDRP